MADDHPDYDDDYEDHFPQTGSIVVLTTAHLDHTPENCADENLRSWCQRCHNTYDAPMRARGIAERRRAGNAAADLFAGGSDG